MGTDAPVLDKNESSVEKTHTNPLSRKINKILETRLENDKVCFCWK